MNEMVEHVARAIGEVLFGYYESLEEGDSSSSAQARLAARTAIAAMREPTGGMVKSGGDSVCDYDGGSLVSSTTVARETWEAMIDAALADNNT